MITYTPAGKHITVKLDGKVAGKIHSKNGGFCYVPKGKSFSNGLYEFFTELADLKKTLEAQ